MEEEEEEEGGEIQQGEGDRKEKGWGGREGEGEVLIERSTGGEEEKEGKRSAEPQLHPLMLHASSSGSSSCPALRSDEEYKCWLTFSTFRCSTRPETIHVGNMATVDENEREQVKAREKRPPVS